MLGLTSLLIVTLFSCFILYIYKCARKSIKNFPPGPPKLPIWGSYWFLLKENYYSLHFAFKNLAKKYKTDILGVYLGDAPAVVTLNYELTKELLTRDEFIGRNPSILIQTRSEGEPKGIFFTDGPIWQSHRRFSLRHLRDYGYGRRSEILENYTLDEIKHVIHFLQQEPKEEDLDICTRKGQVLIPDFLYGSLINIVMLPLSSTQFDHYKVRKYARAAARFNKSADATGGAISITPWLRYIAPDFFHYSSSDKDNRILKDFMKDIIQEHVTTFSDDHHRDFIDDFISENIKQGTDLDYTQLALIVVDYMFPSPIGIGSTLSFFFSLLINHPQVQKNIQKELDTVVGRSKYPSIDDRQNLHYLEASIREAIRILPLLPLGVSKRCVEDTTLGGYFIPKDTVMLPNFWTAQRDEKVFPNPDNFEPERFLNPDGTLMKKDLTLGFSAGKRLCPGETYSRNTMFLIVSGLLQNFTMESTNGKPIDLNDFDRGITLCLKPTWIQFVPR